MNANQTSALLSPLALSYCTWLFWHRESERLRHLREYSLSCGVGGLFQSLAGYWAVFDCAFLSALRQLLCGSWQKRSSQSASRPSGGFAVSRAATLIAPRLTWCSGWRGSKRNLDALVCVVVVLLCVKPSCFGAIYAKEMREVGVAENIFVSNGTPNVNDVHSFVDASDFSFHRNLKSSCQDDRVIGGWENCDIGINAILGKFSDFLYLNIFCESGWPYGDVADKARFYCGRLADITNNKVGCYVLSDRRLFEVGLNAKPCALIYVRRILGFGYGIFSGFSSAHGGLGVSVSDRRCSFHFAQLIAGNAALPDGNKDHRGGKRTHYVIGNNGVINSAPNIARNLTKFAKGIVSFCLIFFGLFALILRTVDDGIFSRWHWQKRVLLGAPTLILGIILAHWL